MKFKTKNYMIRIYIDVDVYSAEKKFNWIRCLMYFKTSNFRMVRLGWSGINNSNPGYQFSTHGEIYNKNKPGIIFNKGIHMYKPGVKLITLGTKDDVPEEEIDSFVSDLRALTETNNNEVSND